jgi:transcriptional regulator with GAF, ATPase, and Fis domain
MDFGALRAVLQRASEAKDPAVILHAAAAGLAQMNDVALARIWLVAPGDTCSSCPRRSECPGHVPCLHLAASAGTARDGHSWDSLSGGFRRFPLGVRKIGIIGQEANALLIERIEAGSPWIVDPEWARVEGIRSMAGHPLTFRGETLGVLAVFVRGSLSTDEQRWLGLFADGAAIALSSARALTEVERLKRELETENVALRDELTPRAETLVGESGGLAETMRKVDLVAKTDVAVLVLGESGVGKELIARAVHERSPRHRGPFIKVNCAAIPRELFESEFFGHVRGAFTGAIKDRIGRFQLADGGTLFLDEIGEVPIELQSKLLRVLQEGTFERVGEERTRSVRARIVAATNRDLEAEARAGTFRQDLYFRLATFPIDVPPLRERREDLPALVTHLVASAASRLGMRPPDVGVEALETLCAYDWPGNVRELGHVVERALILGEGRSFPLSLGPKRLAAPPRSLPSRLHTGCTRRKRCARSTNETSRARWSRPGSESTAPTGQPPCSVFLRARSSRACARPRLARRSPSKSELRSGLSVPRAPVRSGSRSRPA